MMQQLLSSEVVLAMKPIRVRGASVPAELLALGRGLPGVRGPDRGVAEVLPGASWQVAFSRQTYFGSQTNHMSHVDISC